MANEEQLAILKQGVEVWNEWRKKNRQISIDLSSLHVDGMNFAEADFNSINFSEQICIRRIYIAQISRGQIFKIQTSARQTFLTLIFVGQNL